MEKSQSDMLRHLPNVNSLLKISIGLILFTIISTALVYAETMSVTVDGTSYDVEYSTIGMTVSAIEADTNFVSLILAVEVTDSTGVLDITFERTFFDSIYEGLDEDYFVLADGIEATFTEIETTSTSRTLSIELPSGTEELEIIGTVFGSEVVEETEEPVIEETEEPVVEETEEPVIEETEEPVIEETEEPVVEETPKTETPKTQCGPGTILKDGVCVIDPSMSSDKPSQGMGRQMIMGVVAAFVIAGTVGLILAIMSKASKSSN
ncbi:MAG: hypothetical protein K5790_05060 [Nitrosopumilus sp.]|nr:hypothetical protein [Nitrosopumilus sp.]MCV0392649.1 hypothetical protein [Nitrosopumilus sp.]